MAAMIASRRADSPGAGDSSGPYRRHMKSIQAGFSGIRDLAGPAVTEQADYFALNDLSGPSVWLDRSGWRPEA